MGKLYPETSGLVHYGTNVFAYLTSDAKTVYRASDTTMEIDKSVTLPNTIQSFMGANGNLWCISQIVPSTTKVVLIDMATMTVTRTTTLDWLATYIVCDDNAVYVAKTGSLTPETGGSLNRIAASDGTITPYNGVFADWEAQSFGLYFLNGKLWWYVGGYYVYQRALSIIDPTTMTRDSQMSGKTAPSCNEILTDGTYLYYWDSSYSYTWRYNTDLTGYLAETGHTPSPFTPAGMFLYSGYLYIFNGYKWRKTQCSDMVCALKAETSADASRTGSVCDGTSIWVAGNTAATRYLLTDWSLVDHIWISTGTTDAVWYMGI